MWIKIHLLSKHFTKSWEKNRNNGPINFWFVFLKSWYSKVTNFEEKKSQLQKKYYFFRGRKKIEAHFGGFLESIRRSCMMFRDNRATFFPIFGANFRLRYLRS